MKNETGALNPVTPVTAAAPIAQAPKRPQAPPSPPATSTANLRLVIEEDTATGEFIYKTLDRDTGEVILQLPRKEVLRGMANGSYSAGDLIKAKA